MKVLSANLLDRGGEAALIDDGDNPDFDWPSVMAELAEATPWAKQPTTFGGMSRRTMHWYGDAEYKYQRAIHPAVPRPWPDLINRLIDRASELAGTELDSVLLNQYQDGKTGLGWHSDDEDIFGFPAPYTIASLSLGATRQFQFVHQSKGRGEDVVADVTEDLKEGFWVIMSGETQNHWFHQVAPTKKKVGPRINLTIRKIAKAA